MIDPCAPAWHSAATLRAWAIWRAAHPLWKAAVVAGGCTAAVVGGVRVLPDRPVPPVPAARPAPVVAGPGYAVAPVVAASGYAAEPAGAVGGTALLPAGPGAALSGGYAPGYAIAPGYGAAGYAAAPILPETDVPEPATLALLLSGAALAAAARAVRR